MSPQSRVRVGLPLVPPSRPAWTLGRPKEREIEATVPACSLSLKRARPSRSLRSGSERRASSSRAASRSSALRLASSVASTRRASRSAIRSSARIFCASNPRVGVSDPSSDGALVFGGEPLLVLPAGGGHLLGVAGPQRPVIGLPLALQGGYPAVRRLLGLRQPRRLRPAEFALPALGHGLYLLALLLAGRLDLKRAGLELAPQRLYLGLLRLDDGLVVLLELELPARRRVLERLQGRLVPLLVARPLLGDAATDLLVPRTLQLLRPLPARAADVLKLRRVAALLFAVLCPELLLPRLRGHLQVVDLGPVAFLQGGSLAGELLFERLHPGLGGDGLDVGPALLLERSPDGGDLGDLLVAHPELLVGVAALEVGDLGAQLRGLALRVGARGDLLLGGLQGGGGGLEVMPEARHLLFEAVDKGTGRLEARGESGRRVFPPFVHLLSSNGP